MGWINHRQFVFLKKLPNKKKPSIIFLSETLVKKEKVKELCKQLNFAECCNIDVQGRSGGLALLWRNEGVVR